MKNLFLFLGGVILITALSFKSYAQPQQPPPMDYYSCAWFFKPLPKFNVNARDFCACFSDVMGEDAEKPYLMSSAAREEKIEALTPCLHTYIKPTAYARCAHHNAKQRRAVGGKPSYVDCDCHYNMTVLNWQEMWDIKMQGLLFLRPDKNIMDAAAVQNCLR